MKSGCQCQVPRPQSYRPADCRDCGRIIDPRFTSSDENMKAWLNRLGQLPGVEAGFLQHCAAREYAGRSEFGLSFLGRDNPTEALEEAADLANYCLFTVLRARRENREAHEELALEAARHAALAHQALMRLRASEG